LGCWLIIKINRKSKSEVKQVLYWTPVVGNFAATLDVEDYSAAFEVNNN